MNEPARFSEEDKAGKRSMILYSVFVVIFSLILFAVTSQEWFKTIAEPISRFYAKASSLVLNVLGQDTEVQQFDITSSSFSMSIKKGCDAIAPMILYAVSILAFPIAFSKKWKSILTGILALALLNIVRIASLYFIGNSGNASLFKVMHENIWPIIFIVFTLFLWLNWIRKVFGSTES